MRKQGSQKNRAAQSKSRARLIWWIAGTAIAVAALVYFLAIKPVRDSVKLPGAPSHNILLVTLDTTRADHLGCYGDQTARTPNLDRLAGEGVRFARAYCPAPLTLPSHCSILTGLDPVAHGIHNNGHDLPPGLKTLAQILKRYGYSTSAFVSSFSVDSRFGLDRGFDVYDDTFRSDLPFKTMNSERPAGETFARFSRWLGGNGENKFFCWVHYYDPHWPYDPPSPYKEEFAGRPYDGEIAYMDHYVGALLDRLRDRGVLERTIVVIAGDHGEGLGDKVEIGHGIFLYEETLRVPLIFYNPTVFPRSQVIESQVGLVDVAPTVLEIIGLKEEAAGMKGQSLVDWLRGKSRKDLDCLVESFYPRENFGWSELVGLVSARWKFIQSPRPELYDLERDPGEHRNLHETFPERAAELKKKMEEEVLRASSGGTPSSPAEGVRSEDIERLRSLGYVNFAPARPGSISPDPKEKTDLLRLIQQAQAYELEERYAEAEQAYLEILEEIPDSPAGYVNLAIAQALQKKFDRAIETLNRGISRIPDSEILLVRLGHTHLVAGRSRDAFETMNKVLNLNPRNVDALTVCAGILDSEGRKEEARTYYERALAVEPESRHLRMSYAGNLASGGRLREAIEIYKKLIADFPEEQGFYQYIGIAYSYLGEYDQAIAWLERALAVRPTPTGYFNLAVAYEKRGNIQEAVKHFNLYLKNSRGESEANIRKAKAELERLAKGS
ncbi:MAG: sulfatase-like hydrolase/transferase [Candidatus Aminicenantales bacterium]